jgi:uncharacterized protein YndB with AHSA1/START domain
MSTTTTPTRTLVVEKDMPQPPEKIWRALTEAPLIESWLMANDFKPVVGHKFTLRSKPMPNWSGLIESEVLAVESNKRLSYRWNSMGFESVVTWTLTPTGGGTHVRMEQTGFRSEDDANYKGASYGWQKFVGGLERVAGSEG